MANITNLTQHAVKAAGLNVGFLWGQPQAFDDSYLVLTSTGDPLFDLPPPPPPPPPQFVHILRSFGLNQQELREFRNGVRSLHGRSTPHNCLLL